MSAPDFNAISPFGPYGIGQGSYGIGQGVGQGMYGSLFGGDPTGLTPGQISAMRAQPLPGGLMTARPGGIAPGVTTPGTAGGATGGKPGLMGLLGSIFGLPMAQPQATQPRTISGQPGLRTTGAGARAAPSGPVTPGQRQQMQRRPLPGGAGGLRPVAAPTRAPITTPARRQIQPGGMLQR